MRVFLDTNVLVAAFATKGLCADVFRYTASEHELLIGEPVLAETARILETKLRMPESARNDVLRVLRRSKVVISAQAPRRLGIGDPDDQVLLTGL